MAVVTPIRPSHVASRSPRQASRVTTGYSMFVEGGDGRSAWARRWKDLILAHVTDLGGPKGLSEAEISLIRRASAMEIELEAMEARKSEGQKIDFGLYSRLTALLCRMLELVGIKRLTPRRSIRKPSLSRPWRAMRASLSTMTTPTSRFPLRARRNNARSALANCLHFRHVDD
jgi:hypothetical protein